MNTFMRHQAAGLAQCGRGLACLAVAAAVAMLAADPAAAQTTWSATPASGLWNLGSNWASGTAPAASGTLAFGTSTITTTTNNFAAGTRFDGITFLAGAPAYTLSGSSFALGGNVTNNSTNLQTFRLNMTSASGFVRTFSMTDGGGDIELAGSYSGIGFNLSGTGTLILSGSLRGAGSNNTNINANTTLRVSSPGSLPQVGESTNGLTSLNGGTFDLRNDVGQDFSNVRMTLVSATNVFINVDRAVGGTGSNQTMTIGNLAKANNSDTSFIVTGSNGYGLTTGTLTYGSVVNQRNLAITNNAPGQLTMAGFGFNAGPFNNYSPLTLGGTGGSMSIGGLRSDNQSVSASGTFGNGSYWVVKSTAITAIITGSSTYAGTTTVQAGTLRSTANAGLGGAGIARELSRGIGTVTVTGSTAASAVDFSGVTANNVIALSGSTFGASLLNSNAAAATTLDNGVAGITFTNGGSGFTLANLNADGVISVSSGGAAAQISSLGGSLGTVTLTSGGSGYTVGTFLDLTGGGALTNARYRVDAVDGAGAITAISVFNPGNSYTSLPTGYTRASGSGTNATFTFNNNFAVAGVRTTALGTDYTTAPTITTTSGSGLVATANVSSVSLTGTNNSIGGAGAMTIKSAISGASGGFAKVGAGRLTLSASNSYTGATRISEGMLEIGSTGRINGSSGITIAGATAEFKYNSATALTQPITFTQGTISGTGSIATAVTVGTNNVISPGNSPGIQAYTSGLTWASGGTYVWEINDWNGTAGNVSNGFDQVQVSGSPLNVSATSGSPFTILLTSLTGANTAGAVQNFDGSVSKTFTIATSSAGISGFDASKFMLNTAGFTNSYSGSFSLAATGSTVLLNYTAPVTTTSGSYSLATSVSAPKIIVGGSATITATLTNTGVGTADALDFGSLAVGNGVSISPSSGSNLVQGASGTGTGGFTTATAGSYTFTPTATVTNATLGGAATPTSTTTASLTVVDHATSSLSDLAVLTSSTISLGTWDYLSQTWTAGSGSDSFSIFNLNPNALDPTLVAMLDLTGTSATGDAGFTLSAGLTPGSFTMIAGGTSATYSVSFDPTGLNSQGSFFRTFTLQMADQNLPGGQATNTLSVTAAVIVVPEPGAIALAGIGIAAAGYALRRRKASRQRGDDADHHHAAI